jgi:anti-sigma regulatory factor (Ser/Thr protein kinase)
MSAEDLSIRLPAVPENVALVRQAVAEHAGKLGIERRVIEDLKTVVSEACANVVLHAYPKDVEEGPLEVDLTREGEGLQLTVRDRGEGIQPPKGQRPRGMRMGLLLVAAISTCFQLRSRQRGGTELKLLIDASSRFEQEDLD